MQTAYLKNKEDIAVSIVMSCIFFFFTATDLLFSKTLFGKAVPFATAGDCYSAARCPQVLHTYFIIFLLHNEKVNISLHEFSWPDYCMKHQTR